MADDTMKRLHDHEALLSETASEALEIKQISQYT